jgi:hypothetical protein
MTEPVAPGPAPEEAAHPGHGRLDGGAPAYRESLHVPSWFWPAGVALGLLLAAPVHGGNDGVRSWLPYLVGPVLVLLALRRASRGTVRVADGVLHVPGARIPLEFVGAVRALDAEQTRRLRGPTADLRAHVATRAWLKRAVQLHIEDPDDDTPYWLVGSRRPDDLVAALSVRGAPRA